MNKQGEKGIEWTDWTFNPVVGCKHNCYYCYAKKLFTRFHRSFEPTFHPERLDEIDKLKKPTKVFVCSVADLFASWTPKEWTKAVLDKIEKAPSYITFQLLTKNPELIDKDYKFPDNVWVGVTVNNQDECWKIEELKMVNAKVKFVSFEPLLSDIHYELDGINWIIIGKLTGSKKVKLEVSWVNHIIEESRKKGIPIFIKNNIKWPIKVQEFPK